MTGTPGQAPGVVKVRLSGDVADMDMVTAMLAAAGAEILDQSAPRPNRRDPGERIYLTIRIEAKGGQR